MRTFEWPPETPGPVQNFASAAPAQVRIDARAAEPAADLVAHLTANPARVLLAAESAGRRELLLDLLRARGIQVTIFESFAKFVAADHRLGITVGEMDSTLYDAFGQRQVSTIYNAQNQYHVVMEVAPRYWQSPEELRYIYISTAGGAASGTQSSNLLTTAAAPAAAGTSNSVRNALTNAIANTGRGAASSGAAVSSQVETMVPLAAVSNHSAGTTRLAVNHHGLFASTTLSFNLQPGMSLGDATRAVTQAMEEIHLPTSIHGVFAGTAGTFQQSLSSEPLLIGAALLAVYIVLGVLYESYIHPITIISTLPSAGVGAVLALMVTHTEFSIIALIGVILLIGIVKKNAIMMIDFAIHAERTQGIAPREAIHQACLLRFRPIMMTTLAALLGAVPLALSFGNGGELRRPLGISIVGGLIVSQMLTLYTTPVLYVYLDRLQNWARSRWPRRWLDGATEAAQ